ncbi:DUF4265 domain-containing protein [Marinagarivorans algicola]|uniref:DUF4265 domain-containing protein n=1 Tax=Marinagarivorans algicola TaxID=1513270 RepID=UPI0006B4C96A|nr:DUF4265 domain-containing protein [Marinagarivorans algicola]
MSSLSVIEMYAGIGPDGKQVAEKLQVNVREDNACQLVRSPAFIKGLAGGDVVMLNKQSGQFELTQRSGNVCIRVFSKNDLAAVAERLTPELEKLGGDLDIETPRMLVFTIHVSCGFDKIEAILNAAMHDGSVWLYGNVYSEEDGETPLNWWQEILKPQ